MPKKPHKKTPADLAIHAQVPPTDSGEAEAADSFAECNACSSGDCTGLIQTPPQNEGELEAIAAVYDFLPPDVCKSDDKSK